MNRELLLDMLSTPSVSGREVELGKKLYGYAGTFAHRVDTDEIGDVIAVLNPERVPAGCCSPATWMRSACWSPR